MRNHSLTKIIILGLAVAAVVGVSFLLTAPTVSAKSGLTPESIHKTHLDPKTGLGCAVCHETTAKDGGVLSVPVPQKVCGPCHEGAKDLGYSEGKAEKRKIVFSHKAHLEMDKTCADCHKAAAPTAVAMPKHAQCTECHKDDFDNMLCAKCHVDFQKFGLNTLASYKHADDFRSRHPEYARRSQKSCAQCHTETFCLDCHNKHEGLKPSLKYPEKVKANLIHRGDWLTVHRYEAKTDPSSCLKCHGINACNTCHAQRGVGASAKDPQKVHPSGWMTEGSKDFHGEKAGTDIVSCAGCHNNDGPGDCRTCHKASLGLNPHPKDWDPKGLSKKDRMCAQCHSH